MQSPGMRKLASHLTQESFFTVLMCCVFFFAGLDVLFLLTNTLSSFIHCNRRRFLVRSRRHKSSYFKIVQRLRPNPNQLVSPNGKANSKERSQRERADSKSDDSGNFHDLSCEAVLRLHRLESRRRRKPLRKSGFHSFFVVTVLGSRQ